MSANRSNPLSCHPAVFADTINSDVSSAETLRRNGGRPRSGKWIQHDSVFRATGLDAVGKRVLLDRRQNVPGEIWKVEWTRPFACCAPWDEKPDPIAHHANCCLRNFFPLPEFRRELQSAFDHLSFLIFQKTLREVLESHPHRSSKCLNLKKRRCIRGPSLAAFLHWKAWRWVYARYNRFSISTRFP